MGPESNSAPGRRRKRQRTRVAVGLDLLELALTNPPCSEWDGSSHERLCRLAFELGATAEQVPERIRVQVVAANPFAAAFFQQPIPGRQPELVAQPEQAHDLGCRRLIECAERICVLDLGSRADACDAIQRLHFWLQHPKGRPPEYVARYEQLIAELGRKVRTFDIECERSAAAPLRLEGHHAP